MDIILARHAETVFNAAARMQGHMAHTPLTRSGIAQAEAMGAALRETLGDELVQRSGQGMAPTPRARAIWPAVREALAQLQSSLIPNEFVPAEANTSFVLAMSDASAAELIPVLTETLEKQAPRVTLRVVPLTTRDPRSMLDEEACDLAVGYFPSMLADLTARTQSGEPQPFFHQRLFTGEYVCVMRKDHPLAQGPLTIDAFCAARHMLVSFSGRPFGFVDEALATLGRERFVVMTVNQFFTAARVVANANLLTVLPLHFVKVTGYADQLVFRPLPFEVSPVLVDAVWHRRSQQRSSHVWLREVVQRAANSAFQQTPSA
jgi:DNA-binding transcriptional LysR family regulator